MQSSARLVFMSAVTSYLLGRVLAEGAPHPETVVHALTAAFGLEFLIAAWRSLWTVG